MYDVPIVTSDGLEPRSGKMTSQVDSRERVPACVLVTRPSRFVRCLSQSGLKSARALPLFDRVREASG